MSDWKQQAARRRDFRRAKSESEFNGVRPWPARKNTKRWCRGKEGIEHVPKCMPYGDGAALFLKEWRALVCVTCGKQMDYYAPPLDPIRYPRVKPKWVTF